MRFLVALTVSVALVVPLFGCGSTGGGGAGSSGTCVGGEPGAPGLSGLPCNGTPETEPNDTPATANQLATAQCGALSSATDVDWFTFTTTQAGTWLAFGIHAAGDAVFTLQAPDGSTTPLSGKIVVCGADAGRYLLEVSSPSHALQGYSVNWAQ
jgi:hypothetical protein